MKTLRMLCAAALFVLPAVAVAQDASTTGRGAGDKPVGPASENGDATTSHTREPGAMGRSAYPDNSTSAPSSWSDESTKPTGSGQSR